MSKFLKRKVGQYYWIGFLNDYDELVWEIGLCEGVQNEEKNSYYWLVFKPHSERAFTYTDYDRYIVDISDDYIKPNPNNNEEN